MTPDDLEQVVEVVSYAEDLSGSVGEDVGELQVLVR